MDHMRRLPLILLLLCSSPLVAGTEKYLCVADEAVGFSYDERQKRWGHAKFRTDSKYVISEPKAGKSAFEVTKVGETSPISHCGSGFTEGGYLICDGGFGLIFDFKFNKHNGRYLLSITYGYYTVLPDMNGETDASSDTPYMEIGKCSSF